MYVFVPVTGGHIHSRTIPSILASGYPAFAFPNQDADTLIDLFNRWWHITPARFTIVASDVEIVTVNDVELGPPYNVLKDLADCDNPWCISDGCAKYTPSKLKINWTLLRENKDVMKTLGTYPNQKPCYHRSGIVRHGS